MTKVEIELHHFHVKNYFDDFNKALERRVNHTREQIFNYINFQIQIEERRLERYFSELEPNKYIEHQLYIDEIKTIIFSLQKYRDVNFKLIEPIKLNYGINNNEVIKLLYDNLYPSKIELGYEEFEGHFLNNFPKKLIVWNGGEPELINLFSSLETSNSNLAATLCKHFLNENQKPFKNNQLSVVKSKTTFTNYIGKDRVRKILSLINDLLKS